MPELLSSVVVTGLGVVSPIGVGHAQFWNALCAGASGIAPLPEAASLPHLAARVVAFSPREFICSAHLRRMDPLSRTLVAASRLALVDARLDHRALDPARVGVVVGTALGNISESVQYLERLFTKGPTLASPLLFPNLVLNAPASYTAMEIDCTGPNLTVSQGETSGEQAIAVGCDLIRTGRADVVLAGGTDELAEIGLAAYREFGALSSQHGGPEWCSPYDRDRNGVILGEGAGVLVLESPQHARERGARVYAEINDHVGFGVPSSPYDWPRHAPDAAARLRNFLTRAQPPDAHIDLVCGSANSSRQLDACELEVLTQLFGDDVESVALTSIKGAIGEFGAAGALTAVAACLALHHGVLPPLCNLQEPPPECRFLVTPRNSAARSLSRVLQVSIARGGTTVALLLSRAASDA
jgi:3-oxoacyl-[acyl-carrier-protein] synthase II